MARAKLTDFELAKLAAAIKLPKGFSEERSHKASLTSNEHSRAAAQACLLINGGAATAVLAFLARDKIDPTLFDSLPFALLGYTLGVASAAIMFILATESLDQYNQYWFWRVANKPDRSASAHLSGTRYWRGFRWMFALTIAIFISSSIFVASAIRKAPPPQDVLPTSISGPQQLPRRQ
jgi:hypothetical protein